MKKRITAWVMCIVMILCSSSVTVLADSVPLAGNPQEESVQGSSDVRNATTDSDAGQNEETDDGNETESGVNVTEGEDSQDTHKPNSSDNSSTGEDAEDADSTDSRVDTGKGAETESTAGTDSDVKPEEDKEPDLVGVSILLSEPCGDNATWQLESDGTVRVTGTGEMYPFFYVNSLWTNGSTNLDGDEEVRRKPWTIDYCSMITRVVVEEGITSIGQGAFARFGNYVDDNGDYQYGSIRSIKLPSTLEKIYYGAFGFVVCDELIIPGGTEIRDGAFDRCNINKILIEDGVTNIPQGAFSHFLGKEIILPDTVTEIEGKAFYSAGALETIHMSSNIKTIGSSAFQACNKLKNIELPEGLENIYSEAFWGAGLEGDLIIPSTVESVGRYGFASTNIVSVSFMGEETTLAQNAFERCTNLQEVNLPNKLETIPGGSFLLCSSLTSIDLPETIKVIGNAAFDECVSLTEIDIPDSVETIYSGAFYGCTGLQSITLPKSLTDINLEYTGKSNLRPAFFECSNLTDITVAEDNEVYSSYDGCLYNKSKDTLLYIPEGKTEVNVANTVEQVERCLFSNAELRFYGNAPTFSEDSFSINSGLGINATIYYPSNNNTWSEVIKDDHDGTVTWIPWDVPVSVESVTLSPTTLSLKTGATKQLTATVKPDNATDKTVTWESSNTKVATVSNTGLVKAVAAGNANITVKTADGSKTAVCKVTVTASTTAKFPDVMNSSAYYYDAVYWAVDQGITTGRGGYFQPDNTCTRAEAVTFLYRMAGSPAVSGKSNFADVQNTKAFYYKAVIWAVDNGITTGSRGSNGTLVFKPDDTCSRKMIVTFIQRYAANIKKNYTAVSGSGKPFPDVASGAWYTEPIRWAAKNGITTGRGGKFYPDEGCTRAQIVTFLYRYSKI